MSKVKKVEIINLSVKIVFAASVFALLLKAIVIILYVPMQVDGGWSAYSAVAISRGGNASENALEIEELSKINGLTIKHGYDDRSIRLFPMALWFQNFGYDIFSCRFFSNLELLILLVVVWLFFKRFSTSYNIIALVFAFIILDKNIVWRTSDMRPDIALTIFTLLAFYFYDLSDFKIKNINFIISILCAMIVHLIWPTSLVSLIIVYSYFFILLCKKRNEINLNGFVSFALFFLIPTILFWYRAVIFDAFFGPFLGDSVLDFTRNQNFVELINFNFSYLLEKEEIRWTAYYKNSNMFIFIIILFSAVFSIVDIFVFNHKIDEKFKYLIISVAIGLLFMALVDPHVTEYRIVQIVPFIYAIAICFLNTYIYRNKKAIILFSTLVFISMLINVGFTLRTVYNYESNKFNNYLLRDALKSFMPDEHQVFICIGPAELFPYFIPDGKLILFDNRTGSRLNDIDLDQIKYVFINNEYAISNFYKKLQKDHKEYKLHLLTEIGLENANPSFVKVYKIKKLVE